MDVPEKFPEVIRDFLADLTTTFPEYIYLWEPLNHVDADNINPLYQFCLTTYPERFFDILYQNEEVFLPDSPTNTFFLPNVDFKMLFNAPGISENTKQAIWKYLQLVLVTIMGNIKSPASFGDTAGLFEGIEEDELQNKLAETIKGLTDFFKGVSKEGTEMPDMEKAFEEMFDGFSQNDASSGAEGAEGAEAEIPSADDLHNHIKGLFDGKIGKLAKELADELSGDVMNMFDDGSGDATNTADIMKKMMRNPKKIMDLVKKIGSKLDDKMKDGSISQEEIMKEVSEMMTKMKGSGNGKEFESMMKGMMKNMGLGGANLNMGKMNAMMSQQSHKDKMRAKLAKREQERQEKAEQDALEAQQRANVILESKAPNEFVFKLKDEEGVQEKSKALVPVVPIDDDWLSAEPEPTHKGSKKASTGKKGGKKGKK
jgi:hypothetical protein